MTLIEFADTIKDTPKELVEAGIKYAIAKANKTSTTQKIKETKQKIVQYPELRGLFANVRFLVTIPKVIAGKVTNEDVLADITDKQISKLVNHLVKEKITHPRQFGELSYFDIIALHGPSGGNYALLQYCHDNSVILKANKDSKGLAKWIRADRTAENNEKFMRVRSSEINDFLAKFIHIKPKNDKELFNALAELNLLKNRFSGREV